MKDRIYEIDALRGLAAILVLLSHVPILIESNRTVFSFGCVGVELFFIISGFVIFLSIDKISNWHEFIFNRITRLYPTFWLCICITTLGIYLSSNLNNFNNSTFFLIKSFLANLTMLPYYIGYPNIDDSYWTLTTELFFYVFMLILIVLKLKKHIISIGFVFVILSALNRFYIYDVLNFKNEILISICSNPLLVFFPLFYTGILLYHLTKYPHNKLYWFFLLLAFLCQIYIYDPMHPNRGNATITQYVIALLLFYGAFYLIINGKLKNIKTKVTTWLGNISYCVYLLHQNLFLKIILPFIALYLNYWISIIITIFAILFTATIIHFYFEAPTIKWLRGKYKNSFK